MPNLHPKTTARAGGEWRTAALLAMLAVLAVVATACGGSSKGGGSTPGPAGASAAAAAGAVKFSNCMRSHGVTNFPEPNSAGQPQTGPPLNFSSPTYIAALKACKHLSPGGGKVNPPASPKIIAELVKYVACMRTHGVPNMPDPSSAGTLSMPSGSGINPRSPQFQTAQKACHGLLPAQGAQP